MDLPIRDEKIVSGTNLHIEQESENDISNIHQYMRFGDICLTRKEMLTIRLLLSQCRVKEISYAQGCTEMNEHKRIARIKEKLGCPNASPSVFFEALKKHDITLACLDILTSQP